MNEKRELIWLGIREENLVEAEYVPFAFLLCSSEEVAWCHIIRAASELGLPAESDADAEETLEMIIEHLCVDDRKQIPDVEIIADLTAGYGDVKIVDSKTLDMNDTEYKLSLAVEPTKLWVRYVKLWNSRCATLGDLMGKIGDDDTPLKTETREKETVCA